MSRDGRTGFFSLIMSQKQDRMTRMVKISGFHGGEDLNVNLNAV
jgi:hypothetical protein